MLRYLTAVSAMLPTAGAGHTQVAPPATDGFAACSVIYPSKMRLIHTDPLPANQTQIAEMAKAFAANLRGRMYTDEPNIEMLGDCHWEPTTAKATEYTNTIKRNIAAKGMTTFWMRYTPAVAN